MSEPHAFIRKFSSSGRPSTRVVVVALREIIKDLEKRPMQGDCIQIIGALRLGDDCSSGQIYIEISTPESHE